MNKSTKNTTMKTLTLSAFFNLKTIILFLLLTFITAQLHSQNGKSIHWDTKYLKYDVRFDKSNPSIIILIVNTKKMPTNYYISDFAWSAKFYYWPGTYRDIVFSVNDFEDFDVLKGGVQITYRIPHKQAKPDNITSGGIFNIKASAIGLKWDRNTPAPIISIAHNSPSLLLENSDEVIGLDR